MRLLQTLQASQHACTLVSSHFVSGGTIGCDSTGKQGNMETYV